MRYKDVNPKDDTFNLRLLLSEWIRLYKHALTSKRVYDQFANKVWTTPKIVLISITIFFILDTRYGNS